MTTAWSAWYPFVLPLVIGCPDPTVDHALRQAAREFCRKSRAWLEPQDAFAAPGVTQRFDFDPPTMAEVIGVTRCTVAAADLAILSSADLPAGWPVKGGNDPDDALIVISAEEYMLYPAPAAGVVVLLELCVMPTMVATGIGDLVFQRYADTVAAGAIARLCAMPKTAWFDADQVILNRAVFERGIASAANEVFRQSAPAKRKTKSYG